MGVTEEADSPPLCMLDVLLEERGGAWWSEFFADRAKPCPSFVESGLTDQQVYEQATLGGGLGYSEDRLRALWDEAPFSLRVLRQMKKTNVKGPCFGEDFLWALLATKESSA